MGILPAHKYNQEQARCLFHKKIDLWGGHPARLWGGHPARP
jgi:hypothetical protein